MISPVTVQLLQAYLIYDSRGIPTIETELTTSIPSGASTGKHEAVELRDNDPNNFLGKGVLKAINSVNAIIANSLIGKELKDQREIDDLMCKIDATADKSNLGANAILSVSLAVARAIADLRNIPLCKYINELVNSNIPLSLPKPFFNVINGGSHAGNLLGFQEFMIVVDNTLSFEKAMKMGSEVYQHLKKVIKEKYGLSAVNVGDEGGFAPPIEMPEEALELIMQAIKNSGHSKFIFLALDVAASGTPVNLLRSLEFYSGDSTYNMHYKNKESSIKSLTGPQMVEYYIKLIKKYPIISIEDPFDQDDIDSWTLLMSKVPEHVQVVGDDLTVTNSSRIKAAKDANACDCLLLKLNQIGTLTEAIDSATLAYSYKWKVMVSHRSGETEDSFISDLSVGLGAGQIKAGAPCRGERLIKYNQLLRLERALFIQKK